MKSKKAKKKKVKKMEQELVLRIMAIQENVSNDDDVSSREGSIHSLQSSDRVRLLQLMQYIQDSLWSMTDSLSLFFSLAQHLQEDSDLENYLTSVQEDMMEFKLSYEMWRVGRWAVSIPHVSYKQGWQCGMSWRLVIWVVRLGRSLSLDDMLMFELKFE